VTRDRAVHDFDRIEEGCLGRDIWEFKVEHVSATVSKMEAIREKKIISEVKFVQCF